MGIRNCWRSRTAIVKVPKAGRPSCVSSSGGAWSPRYSPSVTVRLRERVTKGAGSRTKGLLMAFKLLDMAQQRWRRLDGAALLPLVRAGVKFVDGLQKPARTSTQSSEAAPRKPPDHAGAIHNN